MPNEITYDEIIELEAMAHRLLEQAQTLRLKLEKQRVVETSGSKEEKNRLLTIKRRQLKEERKREALEWIMKHT